MEWTESLRVAIRYMEEHLLDNISPEDVSSQVNISPFYFQKGFKIMTGYSLGEYIRGRRLYLAALDVIADREKVIDLAYKYGYETPESFTKAFARFHGVSPVQMRGNARKIRNFLPLTITISVKGGDSVDYVVEKMKAFKLVGFKREITMETGYAEIPKYWSEFCGKCENGMFSDSQKKMVEKCCIGEFGVCIDDDAQDGKFQYMIAGHYNGDEVPEGMVVYEIPELEWAKFKCVGPMPEALQTVNTQIFQEWLPGNTQYEFAIGMNIEWYSKGDGSSIDYESGIWVPVKRK